jgi:hypothetical protein
MIYFPQGFPVSLKQENAEVMHERGFRCPTVCGATKTGEVPANQQPLLHADRLARCAFDHHDLVRKRAGTET